MTKLDAGLSRDAAYELLAEHNKDQFHLDHGVTVENTMRYFAREYDPENEEFWGIVGLLHDLDWEEHDDEPVLHTVYAAPLIEAAGGSPELIHSIQSHNWDANPELEGPSVQMEKILYATEELTGLIGAAVVMRPSKSVMDFEVSSLKKKFKNKKFAAGVDREVIRSGADLLGWDLDTLFTRTIEAMRSFAPDRDTFGQDEPAAEEDGSDQA
ncbi:MAG: HD family phosphohydrolase [Eggerthellaceae bacterium]|nr:HD family phosphohydrolase [Eggerthellaceae bacterium]